jgi:DNA invertase Pin-like site-specific DNA recombinase
MQQAFAYMRTSSAQNAGNDKDSQARQRAAINAFAAAQGFTVAREFYDAAVSGADPIEARAGFSALLACAAETGIKCILVENASRFARDLIVQETGYAMLTAKGFTLIASDDADAFVGDTPTARMVRQILGSISEFEKNNLVLKLRGARERMRVATGRCEGVRGYDVTRPELVAAAHEIAAAGGSLRSISAALAAQGFVTSTGKPFAAMQVKRLLAYQVGDTTGMLTSAMRDADELGSAA